MAVSSGEGGGGLGVATPFIKLSGISKSYGATQAVDDVSLEIRRGSVLGLVGENGAGKSTLAKVLAGVVEVDSGTIEIDGKPCALKNPREALSAGIALMAQEISLVPEASVEENVLLGSLPSRGSLLRRRELRRRFEELRDLAGFDLQPQTRVSSLRLADQQKVELLRALSSDSQVIVMDEPSAALSSDEVASLHSTIRHVVASGSTVILISHFLEEVLSLSDEIAIMRDGHLVRFGDAKSETVESLVAGMVGSELATDYNNPHRADVGNPVLTVRSLSSGDRFTDINFELSQGEIVGLAGLVGAGRTEVARSVYGADPFSGGSIELHGQAYKPKSPGYSLRRGVFMVPESRKDQGLVMTSSVEDNLALANLPSMRRAGFVRLGQVRETAKKMAMSVGLKFASLKQQVQSLSGGNQQKVLFGRAQWVAPKVLIVDEPTRGVDIAAKRSIHADLERAADQGTAILFISSELDEVMGVCSRILVMWRGNIVGEFAPPYNKELLVKALFGEVNGDV